MKKLLYVFFLISYSSFAQITECGSFKILEAELLYQKVVTQDSITADKMVAFLKTIPTLGNIQSANEIVTADLVYLTVDYKKYKFAQSTVPAIIQTGKFNGKLAFEIKQGKYRVTLRSIQMKGDLGFKKLNEPESITNYACTDNGTAISKEWCKPSTLGLLEQVITDRLKFKEVNTDWK